MVSRVPAYICIHIAVKRTPADYDAASEDPEVKKEVEEAIVVMVDKCIEATETQNQLEESEKQVRGEQAQVSLQWLIFPLRVF